MPDQRAPLLILGASTRAAAHSAARAGFRPFCADFFGDVDLRDAAEILPLEIQDYPDDLSRAAALAPPAPWMYTGALENYPDVVDAISRDRPLWGATGNSLRRARNPDLVYDALTRAGLPAPRVRPAENPPPADGRYVLKPHRSGGGRGIRIWNARALRSRTLHEPHWFQERIRGDSLAAVFLAAPGAAMLVGATHQTVGHTRFGARPFAYCGSIGPLELPGDVRDGVARVGSVLSEAAGLRGLFGIDFIVNAEGAWPIDLNPRYTASVEVLEFATGLPLVEWHARACREEDGARPLDELAGLLPRAASRWVGKAVLFARRRLIAPSLEELARRLAEPDRTMPAVADRPVSGSVVPARQPLCTVLATGSDERACRQELARRVQQVEQEVRRETEGATAPLPGSPPPAAGV